MVVIVLFIAAIFSWPWSMLATVVHRRGECAPPPTSHLGGTLPNTRSPISSREETSLETAHQEKETIPILDGYGRLAEAE
jgi:hypothetical protein